MVTSIFAKTHFAKTHFATIPNIGPHLSTPIDYGNTKLTPNNYCIGEMRFGEMRSHLWKETRLSVVGEISK